MADDNSLDIYLRIITQNTGEKPEEVLKKIKAQVTETGKEGVKQEEAVTEATEKTFTSKKQLKDMVKQVGKEFPILGQLGRLALNPIAFTTASIVAGFQIWKHRTEELTKTLGGLEMNNFSETQVQYIERMAKSIERMAVANAGQSTFAKMKSDAEAFIQLAKDNDTLFKAMGIDTGTKSLEEQAAIKGDAASKLEADAKARRAAAGRPMSKDKEEDMSGKMKEDAAMAEKALAEFESRRDFIVDYKSEKNPFARAAMAAKFLGRYGRDLTPNQALDAEQANVDEQQSRISRFARFGNAAGNRAGSRAMHAVADQEETTAAGFRNEQVQLLRAIAAGVAGGKLSGSPSPGGNITDPAAIQQQIQFFNKQPELMAAIERALIAEERLRQRVTNLERR